MSKILWGLLLWVQVVQAIGPAPELPPEERSQQYRVKALEAVNTGNIEGALKWYSQLTDIEDKEHILGMVFTHFFPRDFSDSQIKTIKEFVAVYKKERVFPGPVLEHQPDWQKLLVPPSGARASDKPLPPQRTAPKIYTPIQPDKPTQMIEIYSVKDEARILLPITVVRDPNVSTVLATSIEKDPTAKDIPVVATGAMLGILKPILEAIENFSPPDGGAWNWNRIPAGEQKVIVESIVKRYLQDKPRPFIAELIGVANWLGAPILLDAAAWKYATLLHNERKSIRETIENDHITKDLLPLISRQYFLQYDVDIDTDLGIKPTFIPLETLVAYGKLPAGKTANELLYDLPDDPKKELLMIKALRKVRGFDPNTTPPVAERRLLHDFVIKYVASSNENLFACIEELLRAEANPNLNTSSNLTVTALFFAVNSNVRRNPHMRKIGPLSKEKAAMKVTDLLMEFGADPNLVIDSYGKPETALDFAIFKKSDPQVIEHFRKKGARTAAELKAAKK